MKCSTDQKHAFLHGQILVSGFTYFGMKFSKAYNIVCASTSIHMHGKHCGSVNPKMVKKNIAAGQE